MQNHKLKIFIITMLVLAFAGCATVYPLGFTAPPQPTTIQNQKNLDFEAFDPIHL